MTDVARLGYSVDTDGLVDARQELVKLKEAATGTQQALKDIGGAGASGAFTGLNTGTKNATDAFTGLGNASNTATGKILDNNRKAANDPSHTAYRNNVNDSATVTENASRRMVSGYGAIRTAIATLGVVALFKDALSAANNFEASMNDVEEKLGGTVEEMELLKKAALEMGSTTAFSAAQSADAISALAARGKDTQEIIGVLPDVLNLAAAAQLTLEQSAKLTTATMNQFNIETAESERVVNLLAAVGDSSGATIQGLEAALSKAGPAANSFGVSLESSAAVVAILADNSIEAEVAGTAMAGMFAKLMIATGDGADAMKEVGLASEDFIRISENGEEHFIGYADAMDLLSDSGAKATQIQRIFGLEAGKNLIPLVNAGGDAIREMEASFRDASSASEQAATQMKGMPGVLKNFKSAFEGLQIAFSNSFLRDATIVVLEKLTDAMRYMATDGIESISKKIDAAKPVFNVFMEFATGAARLVAPLAGHMDLLAVAFVSFKAAAAISSVITAATAAFAAMTAVTGGGVIASAIGGITVAFRVLSAVVISNPIVAGITAIATAAYLIYDNWDGLVEWFDNTWGGVIAAGETAINWFKGLPAVFSGLWDSVGEFEFAFGLPDLGSIVSAIIGFHRTIFNAWISLAELVFNVELPTVGEIINDARDLLSSIGSWWEAQDVLEFDVGVPVLSDVIGGLVSFHVAVLNAWLRLAELTFGIELPSASELIAGLGGIIDNVKAWWDDVSIFEFDIKLPFVGDKTDEVRELAEGIERDGKGFLESAGDTIGGWFGRGLSDGIDSGKIDVEGAAAALAQAPVDTAELVLGIQSPSRVMRVIGGFIAEGMAAGIDAAKRLVTASSEAMASEVIESVDSVVVKLDEQYDKMADASAATANYEEAAYGASRANTTWGESTNAVTVGTDDLARSAEEAERATQRFVEGLVNSVASASSVKEGLSNLGNYLKDWLFDKIKLFAANEITAVLGMNTDGASAGLSSFTNLAKDLFGQTGGAAGEAAGGLSTVSTSLTSMTAAAAPFAIAAVAVVGALVALKEIADATNTSYKNVALFGAVGGSLIGGKDFEHDRSGIDVGFSGGEVVGNDVDVFKKKKSFWRGNDYREELSELDSAVGKQLTDYFTSMNSTIVESAGALGVAGADAILADFEVATQRFIGSDADEELAAWLEQSTIAAYQHAFTNMGPEVQSIIDEMIDIDTASAEEIAAVFEEVGTAAALAIPALELVGLTLGDSADSTAAIAIELADALGGTEAALAALDLYAREFVPAGELAANTLIQQTEGLESFNTGLEMVGLQAITTREGMHAYVESLEAQYDAGLLTEAQYIAQTAAAMNNLGAIVALEDAHIAQTETLANVTDVIGLLNLQFDATGPMASEMANGLVEMMGGMDAFNAATASYYQNFYSEQEQQQAILQKSTADVFAFNQGLGLTGAAAINTEAEFRAYVDSLDLTTEAGQRAFAAAMEVESSMRMIADTAIAADEAMAQLHEEQARQIETLGNVRDVARDLNLNFDATSPSAINASNALIELMGGMDGFSAANQNYYDTFYTEQERTQIALTNAAAEVHNFNSSLGLTGDAAIDTRDEFRAYVEGLDLQTEAGREAYAAALELSDSMGMVVDSEQSVSQIMAEMPENMQNSFNEMTDTASASAEQIAQSQFDLTNAQTEAALTMKEIIVTNIDEQTNSVAAGYLAQATSTADFISRAGELQAAGQITELERQSLMVDAMGAHQDSLINLATDGSAAQVIAIEEGNFAMIDAIVNGLATRLGLEVEAQAAQTQSTADHIQAANDLYEAGHITQLERQAMITDAMIDHQDTLAQIVTEGNAVQMESTAATIERANEMRAAGHITQLEHQAIVTDAMTNHQSNLTGIVTDSNAAQVAVIEGGNAAQVAAVTSGANDVTATTADMAVRVAGDADVMKNNAAQNAEIMALLVTSATDGMSRNVTSIFGTMTTNVSGLMFISRDNWQSAAAAMLGSSGAITSSIRTVADALGSLGGAARNAANSAYNSANTYNSSQQVLGSYMVGTDYVPQTGLYELHEGEIVIPPRQSEELRNFGIGSQTTNGIAPTISTINVNRNDSRSTGLNNDDLKAEIAGLRRDLEDRARVDQQLMSESNDYARSTANSTARSDQGIDRLAKETNRNTRRNESGNSQGRAA